MDVKVQELKHIFDELIVQFEGHKHRKRIIRYAKKLSNLTHFEMNMLVTIELCPYYVKGEMDKYINTRLRALFKIVIPSDRVQQISEILSEICRINLS